MLFRSSSNEYYDNAKGACVACSSSCETCSGAGDSACLSCSSTSTLKQGTCSATDCTVVSGFGVCLESLVTVAATSVGSSTKSTTLPWWIFLIIGLAVLILIGLAVYFWRRKEKKRRESRSVEILHGPRLTHCCSPGRLQTQRFANDLGAKEVDLKLRAPSPTVAYPPLPRADTTDEDVPLTPRFVIEDSPHPVGTGARYKFAPPQSHHGSERWSASSYGSRATFARPIQQQNTDRKSVV